MVVGEGYFSHDSSQSENVASVFRVLNYDCLQVRAIFLIEGRIAKSC